MKWWKAGAAAAFLALACMLAWAAASAVGGTARTFSAPTVTSLSVTSGHAGDTITVHGTGFVRVSSVKFNGVAGMFNTVATDGTSLKAVVPAAATDGAVSVTTPGGVGTGTDTFHVLPKIATFTPASGKAGVTVTISGSGLASTTSVDFVGHAGVATSLPPTANAVKVVVPNNATTGTLALNTPNGDVSTATSFKPLPAITGLSALDGHAGDSVQIFGTNLSGETSVKFGTIAVTPTLATATEIDAPVPGVPFSSGKVTVVTPTGTSVSTQTFAITKVTSVSPLAAVAGTTITIAGQGLSSATTVDFGNHAGVAVSGTPTATAVKVVVPDDAVVGALTVNTPHAGAVTVASFKPLPKITSLNVVDGQVGDTVHVTGTNLLVPSTDKFGTSLAGSAASVDSDHVDLTVPGAPFSSGKVSITTPAGTATSTQTFTITKVTSVSPVSAAAGATLTISGQGLTSAAAGTIDFQNHTGVTPLSSTATSVKVVVPPDAMDGPLTVHTGNGASASTVVAFKPLPRITGFDQQSYAAGDTVTVIGTNLSVAGPVSGKLGATAITPINGTAISFQFAIPNAAVSGSVSYTDAAGSTTSTGKVLVVPTITGDPAPNEATIGTRITITGKTFTGTTSVKFGADTHAAPFVIGGGGTTLTITVPATALSGKITITNAGGSTQTTNDFVLDPTITVFSPSSAADGATLTVAGTGLVGANEVDFGGGVSAVPTGVTATSLSVVVPNGAASGHISVHTAAGGASAASATSLTITATLASVSQDGGAIGASIELTGEGFGSATDVLFNGTSVGGPSVLNVIDFEHIVVTVPSGASDGPITVVRSVAPFNLVSKSTFRILLITSLSAAAVHAGEFVEIGVSNIELADPTAVTFTGGATAMPSLADPNDITFTVPADAQSGPVTISTTHYGSVTTPDITFQDFTGIVINEVGMGSGTSFVELYNTTDATVDMALPNIVFRQPAGIADISLYEPTSLSIPAHSVLSVEVDTLPEAGGGIALEYADGTIVDSVGWGTATNAFVEGTAAPAPATGHSIGRSPDGADTNDNSADFYDMAIPSPGSSNAA